MRIYQLPTKTKKLINHYLALRIGPQKIPCPYFQNITGRRTTAVFAGKGLPQEIERETLKLFSKRKKSLAKISKENIRLYMTMAGLGIDCSGLVTNILNCFLQETKKQSLWEKLKYPTRNPLRLLIYRFRPRQNISAAILSHPSNVVTLKNTNEVKPGDLLMVSLNHIVIVEEIEVNNKKEVIRIGYVHSTSDYLDQHGVRRGNVYIVFKSKPLESQKWDEEYRRKNWMLKDFLSAPKNQRGLKRLKILL